MRLREWIAAFRWLHEKARRGALAGDEVSAYHEAREDLAHMLLAAQRLTLMPGETAREALRVVRLLPLELGLQAGPARSETLDISTGGFSSLLDRAPAPAEQVNFVLRLGSGPLHGRALIANILQQGSVFRVSFKLEGASAQDAERLGTEVMDAALEQLANLVEHA